MRRVGKSALLALVGLAGAWACVESKQGTVSPGDNVVHDNPDGQPPPPPPPPPPDDSGSDGPYESGIDGYGGPDYNACASCTCDPSVAFCFGGGTRRARVPFAGAEAGPPPPPCPMVGTTGAVAVGCNALPANCVGDPMPCACVINTIQPQFSCFLDCTPDLGPLLAYCP